MDNPYDRMSERNATRNAARRNAERDAERARRKKRRSEPNRQPDRAPNENRGGGNNQGGGNPLAPKWGRYHPGPYDPDNPYNQPIGGKGRPKPGVGRKLGQHDPEALLSRKFGRAGIGYFPNSPDEYDQFIYDQAQNALMGLRTARLDRPNLKAAEYFNKLPIFQGMGNFGEDETGMPDSPPRRGRPGRPRR